MPIKRPVAPLEFTFLADAHFPGAWDAGSGGVGLRHPAAGCVHQPIASKHLGAMLDERKIGLEADFLVERVEDTTLVSYDEREIPFDLLVTVPSNMGADNFFQHARGEPMTGRFDGHANCFIESGGGKGLLIDFNYDTEPLPGKYPIPGVGPFALLKETAVNYWGKLAFRWMYWHVLLPGRPIPLPAHMSMAGKHPEKE